MTTGKKIIESVLAIDAGTQSIRAALIDFKGNILKICKTEIEPYFSLKPGWAEQHPEYFWKVLGATSKKLLNDLPVKKESIRGVTLTTQRDTMVNLDKDGIPLRPAIIWLDRRRADKIDWPPLYLKLLLKAIKFYDPLIYSMKESEANWIYQNEPKIWDKTDKFLFLSGYLTYKLTGEFVDSTGNQVGYVPFDYKRHRWAKDSDLKWKMFPCINRNQLPNLVKPSELLGYISSKAAMHTGIPSGLPIFAAAADKACEVLGSGCLSPEIACLSFGTTATIETTNKEYKEIIPPLPPYPSAVPGAYNTEVMIYRGYWMVSWFKNEFAHNEVLLAQKKRIAPEVILDQMASTISPGSMGLMLQPFWSSGVKEPGPEAKGAIIGFGDVHTRAHVYRSIIEGLSYALKEGAIRTEKKNGVPIQRLRISGGGSQSKTAMQVTADIFNLVVEQPHTFETSALGAAIDAAVGLKVFGSFNEAVQSMTKISKVYEPDQENNKIYKDLFENVYMKLYSRMRSLYKEIRRITNYPPIIKH
ncbi:MAG: FGGY-family carbohydrate kinase [Spirochaetes bacterium]|nr:FGGY-family carbohydrate kinase [Spirochaetota bacterium]